MRTDTDIGQSLRLRISKKLGILKLEDRIKQLEMNYEHKLFYGHLIWMKNLLKGQMYTHIGLANMTIASMFLWSIICHLLISIIMGSPHGTHFLKKFYQSKIISKIQKGSLKWLLQLRGLGNKDLFRLISVYYTLFNSNDGSFCWTKLGGTAHADGASTIDL